ncbi:MAG: response regulator [Lachnospiraceae bacterium]
MREIQVGTMLTINTMKECLPIVLGSIGLIFLGLVLVLIHGKYKLKAERKKNKVEMEALEQQLLQMEQDLEIEKTANKRKTIFLEDMATEIRAPLSTMIGINEMILREGVAAQIPSYATNIKHIGNLLLSFTNDILEFSNITSGQLEIARENYDLRDVIREVVDTVSPLAEDKNLETKLDVDEKTPRQLHGDAHHLMQVMLNLLSNAVKYTPLGSITFQVGFEVSSETEIELCVTVSDTGIGIREEDIPKLFNAFECLDREENQSIEGTGLGLMITQSILKEFGTTLVVKSEYGQGSEFSFRVKQSLWGTQTMGVREEILDIQEDGKKREERRFFAPNGRILAVDDSRMNLAVIRGLLKRNHIQIDTAESGKECLEMVQKKQYHVILLDYMMPQMDGAQTLKRLKKLDQNLSKDAAIIAVTANAMGGIRETYLNKGFTDYLAKPLESDLLEEMLQNYLPSELVVPEDSYTVEMAEDVMSIRKDIEEDARKSDAKEDSKALEEWISKEEFEERIREIRESIQNFELEQAREQLRRLSQFDMERTQKDEIFLAIDKMEQQEYADVEKILKMF